MNIPELNQYIISKCKDRFETFSKIAPVEPVECKLSDLGMWVNYRSEIFLYGVDLTVRFQIVYSDEDFQEFLKDLFDQVSPEKVRDFFNEICNLSLGKTKELFASQGVTVAISLPVGIDTTKARLMMAGEEVLKHTKVWFMKKNEKPLFYVKVSLEIHRPESLEKLTGDSAADSQEGEVEFL